MANGSTSLNIGRVLSATFGVIARHPAVFFGLSFLVAGLPYGMLQFFALSPELLVNLFPEDIVADVDLAAEWIAAIIIGIGLFAVYFFLTVLLQAMLIVASIYDLRGKPVEITTCLTEALNRFFPIIGVGLLSVFGIFLGLILLVVPGVILFLMWAVAVPAMVTEKLGVIESLQRSAELTSGSKGMIFLLAIIYIFATSSISGLVGAAGFFNGYASIAITIVVGTAIAAVQAAGIAALYIELRTIKEGPLNDTLANVFA